MAVVDARAEFVVDRDRLLTFVKRDSREFTQQSLADAICGAFCGPQGLARGLHGLQLDIHRRQHLEIAQQIFENDRSDP